MSYKWLVAIIWFINASVILNWPTNGLIIVKLLIININKY